MNHTLIKIFLSFFTSTVSCDQVQIVFKTLNKLMRHITNPSECTSAERCILAYLYDLNASCSILNPKSPTAEPLFITYSKIKETLFSQQKPVVTIHTYDETFMKEILDNPRRGGKIDPTWSRLLCDSPANRYSFVCNAVIAVSQQTDNDRVNDISIMCAELTASCNSLSSEWLCAFMGLCASKDEPFYKDIVDRIDVSDVNLHNALAVLICILVG